MLPAVLAHGHGHAAAGRNKRGPRATVSRPSIAIAESAVPSLRQRTGGGRTVHGSLREAACLARRQGPSAFCRPQVEGLAVGAHARAAPVPLPPPARQWALAPQIGRFVLGAPSR